MSEPCAFLDWDTNFFGVRIARVNEHVLPDAAAVDAWCAGHAIDCLYFLADMNDVHTIRAAHDHDYRFQDVRVTLEHALRPLPELPATLTTRLAEPGDVARLMAVARTSYTDSRYYFDPCFPREKCDALYETWIRRSCEGYADAVLVVDYEGQASGFISCHRETAQIGLVGVAPEARGRYIGNTLVIASLHWFKAQGAESVTVVTQGRNIGAQRLYQRCGFTTREMQVWFHKWFKDCHA